MLIVWFAGQRLASGGWLIRRQAQIAKSVVQTFAGHAVLFPRLASYTFRDWLLTFPRLASYKGDVARG